MKDMSWKGKLLVIDGHNLLFRAFYALPPMSSKDGLPTNAVLGFLRMLLKLMREEEPTHLAVAFDSPTPTFRHQQFEAYKAQREKAPDAFHRQVPVVKEILAATGVAQWEVEGFEADDLMAAAVRKAKEQGIEVLLVSGDVDVLQLVGEGVMVLSLNPNTGETIRYDPKTVKERLGVEPKQIPDYKGLQGDASDNLPGVKGIGPKTAQRLLQQFDSIEKILENIASIQEPALRENLKAQAEQALQSKRLATLVSETPLNITLPDCAIERIKLRDKKVAQLFKRLDLMSLIRELDLESLLVTEKTVKCWKAGTLESLQEASGLPRRYFEPSSLQAELVFMPDVDGGVLRGIAVSLSEDEAVYVSFDIMPERQDAIMPTSHQASLFDEPSSLQAFKPSSLPAFSALLADASLKKTTHDLKNLLRHLPPDVEVKGLCRDTMLFAYLLDPDAGSYELNKLASQLGWDVKLEAKADEALDDGAKEALSAAAKVRLIANSLEGELRRQGIWELYEKVEMPLVAVLAEMERHGVLVDLNYLRKLSAELQKEAHQLEKKIHALAGEPFNIRSPKQLQRILFEKLKLPTGRRTKTGFSTRADVLEGLAKDHEIVRLILDYRELEKLKGTYADGLAELADPSTHRVHTTFHQTGTSTGRLSSSNPNLQNIPIRSEWGKKIRRAFVAPQGCLLLSADYSQIELRLLAHVSGDQNLRQAFLNDEDIHARTAADLFGVAMQDVTSEMRRTAKVVNFGITYGISAFGLSQQLSVDADEAQRIIERYFSRYPKVQEYVQKTLEQARTQGYVETILARRRYIRGINSTDQREREAAQRAAINHPIQGSSADLIKMAMVKISEGLKQEGLSAKMLVQVHDELVFETPEREVETLAQLVRKAMEGIYSLSVPLKVNVEAGRNWLELEPV